MTLPAKVRVTFGVQKALSRLGLAPTNDKVIRWPVEKRLAMGPGRRVTGQVVDVPTRDVAVPTRDGATVQVRVYEPVGATAPVLYAHGGGFAIGGLASCDHICRRLAVESQTVVVSVQYRLAPEHPFPGPLDDVEDALDWLLAQGWDNERLMVGGDSAGGNLAAALALRLRDRGTPLAGQLLIYPALDLTATNPELLGFKGVGITPADCQLCASTYLAGADPRDPFASPLHAPDLGGLAPALVLVVEEDPLRYEAVEYVERLRAAGVPTRLLDVDGHAHGSLSVPTLYAGIDEVYTQLAAFVREPKAVTS